jgi:hypothetical protein
LQEQPGLLQGKGEQHMRTHVTVPRAFICLFLASSILSAQAQTTVAGALKGEFSVSPSGAATYRLPLQLPPGIAGMKPKLEMVYNSQGGNGMMGLGWGLSGLSAITRCPRTPAQDGARGSVNFDVNDRFCLDGQRLILVAGTYGAAASEYRTEIETFSKITAVGVAGDGPASFLIKTKSGLTQEYGNTPDSLIEAQGKSTARVWAQNRSTDVKGNYITFSYTEDSANGAYYPVQIQYGGNSTAGVAPANTVGFSYATSSTDITMGYTAGSLIKRVQRLTSIAAGPELTYKLTYGGDILVPSSHLKTIGLCTAASCLEPLNVGYPVSSEPSFPKISTADSQTPWATIGAWSGDLNGDGKTDLFTIYNGSMVSALSKGDGTFTRVSALDAGATWDPSKAWTGDFNGDGLTDLLSFSGGNLVVQLSKGDGTFAKVSSADAGTAWDPAKAWTGDFNGDSFTDLLSYKSGNLVVFLGKGDGTFTKVTSADTGTAWDPAKAWTGDFNGDGYTDLMSFLNGNIVVFLSKADGTFTKVTSVDTGTAWDTTKAWVGDFDGDGLTDLVSFSANRFIVFLSKGDGTFAKSDFADTGVSWDPARVWAADLNGDGLTDLWSFSAGKLISFISQGDGTFVKFSSTDTTTTWDPTHTWMGDFNGDGQADLLSASSSNLVTLTVSGPAKRTATKFQVGTRPATDVVYSSLSQANLYTKDSGANRSVYPRVDLQAPLYVVKQVDQSHGVGAGSNSSTYTYGGLKAELATGRGMLGFRWLTSRDTVTGIENYSEYRQDFPYIGMPAKNEVRLTGSGNAGVLKRSILSPGCVNADGGTCVVPVRCDLVVTNGAACKAASDARFFPYVASSQEDAWDLNGVAYPQVTTSTTYGVDGVDGKFYGDPVAVSVGTSDGSSRTTNYQYKAVDTVNWILGRVLKTTVTSTKP